MTIAAKAKARRIASDEAHSWARNLRVKNPSAKLVLSMLTLYVNGEGCCFVSIQRLADDCEMSEDTVRRRLVYLETIGAIVRFPQWRDDQGRRNGEGRGKRTTDDIRLMLTANEEEIEARANGDAEPVSPSNLRGLNSADGAVSPSSLRGLNDGAEPTTTAPAPPLGVGQPSHCGEGIDSSNLNPEPEPEIPPSPQKGVEEKTVNLELQKSFDRLAAAYPIPITNVPMTLTVLQALIEDKQDIETIVAGAAGYAAFLEKERSSGRSRHAKDAHRWLREHGYLGYQSPSPTPPAVEPAPTSPTKILVEIATREGKAWLTLHYVAGLVKPLIFSSPDRVSMPNKLPPAALIFADDLPPERDWHVVEKGSPSFAAWRDFLNSILGKGVGLRSFGISEEIKHGLRVPWPWPPRKDGTLSPDQPDNAEVGE